MPARPSLVPATLALLAVAAAAGPPPAGELTFPTPSDDRWHYPFNFTPGQRPRAPCFGSVGNGTYPLFNDRDGFLIAGWNTADGIAPGRCPERYDVRSIRVTATNTAGAIWAVDRTADEWFTFDVNNDGRVNGDGVPRGQPGDRDGESSDPDPGRPLELFGAGFGPETSYVTWRETTFYYGATDQVNAPRDPFPFVFQDKTLAPLHVEDNVKGTQNENLARPVYSFTPRPWAVGAPVGYAPGRQSVSFDVNFDVDLGLSDGAVRRYFQEQLSGGRVIVIVTSLQETIMFGGEPGSLPTFYTKESLGLEAGARAPHLTIHFEWAVTGDADGDCDVDVYDGAALTRCLSGPGATSLSPPPPLTPEACRESFDFDRDADVDLRDTAQFMREVSP
jgi:hypothetical protein